MKRNSILLVEDNPSDIELTKRAFLRQNIQNELIIMEDGQEALDYLFCEGSYTGRDSNDQPLLVLLDLKLPGVDGLEVLRQIRMDERTKRLCVVILTSSREDTDLSRGYDLGVNSYIVKPVDFLQFSEVVRNLGLYWLVLNELPGN